MFLTLLVIFTADLESATARYNLEVSKAVAELHGQVSTTANDNEAFRTLVDSGPPLGLPGSEEYLKKRRAAYTRVLAVYRSAARRNPSLKPNVENFIRLESIALGDVKSDSAVLNQYRAISNYRNDDLTALRLRKVKHDMLHALVNEYHKKPITMRFYIKDIKAHSVDDINYFVVEFKNPWGGRNSIRIHPDFRGSIVDVGSLLVAEGVLSISRPSGDKELDSKAFTTNSDPNVPVAIFLNDPKFKIETKDGVIEITELRPGK